MRSAPSIKVPHRPGTASARPTTCLAARLHFNADCNLFDVPAVVPVPMVAPEVKSLPLFARTTSPSGLAPRTSLCGSLDAPFLGTSFAS